jgi:sulfatase maturation enzyme AslB (radical SAM superfamily)
MQDFHNDIDKQLPTFCATPFVSLMVNTDATVRYCCMVKGALNKIKKPDGKVYTIQDQFVQEAWNSKDMQDIRLAMVNGQKVEGCSTCYLQEESGRVSNRQHSNQEWSHRLGDERMYELIDEAIVNNGSLEHNIAYLDLRLGNLCNLKCRMCNPYNSSQIAKEHMSLTERDEQYKVVWAQTFGKFNSKIMDVQEWFDQDILWDQVIGLIPRLHKVYMTGGEPTLIKNNFKFMEACIEQGRTDITLFFNTNCTNINKRFLELIRQFDTVHVNASLDGVGSVNEYIRAPSDWKLISENVEKLAQMPNVVLGVTPTVQVYNIFNLVDMLEWVNSLNNKYKTCAFVDFLINVHPHQLAVGILPDDVRLKIAQDLIEYRDNKFNALTHDLTKNSTNGIIGLLQRPRAEDWPQQMQAFKMYTESLDKERAQDINQLDTRFTELINAI